MEPLLSVVDKETLEDVAYSLDRLKGKIEYWRMLIPLLPKESYRYNKVDVEQIAFVGTKGGSSSLVLLQEFQRKRMGLGCFKNMLQKIDCQGALDCFKQPTIPVIVEHPKSTTIVVNNQLELQCVAKCIPEPPDYQWFVYREGTSKPVKGAKSWRLIIKVTMTHNRFYCCRVQNRRRLKDDRCAVFSDYAMVTVKHDKHDEHAELETSGGSTHSLTPVQEVTDRPHKTFPASISPSYEMVTDGVSKIELKDPIDSTDTVGPDQLIKIVTQPKSQTVRLTRTEETVTLECQAESRSGGDQLEYKWYYLSGNVNPATMKKENKNVKSTNPCYAVTIKPYKKQVFRYYCEVSIANQPECCVPSDVAVIKLECVWFVDQPQEKYVTVTGKDLKVSCRVEKTPDAIVQYQWFTCKQDGTGKKPAGYYENEMMLPANISSRGYYVCGVNLKPAISDEIYSNVTHVEVVNSINVTVEVQPPTDRYVELNEKLVIKFRAVCKQHPVKYQWYRNGEELTGCTNPTLTIESIANHHMGSYYCAASSDYSATPVLSETCRVHWKEPNAILSTINRQQFDAEEAMIINDRVYATDKMALLIGNCKYKGKPLKCSENDVRAVTDKLCQLNFKTISLVDLTLSQMARAVDYFCTLLDRGMYAVFYYSGHGLENQNTKRTYLMPIDADKAARFDQCMDVDDVAGKMQARQSKVVMIFDCCRINTPSADAAPPLSSVPSSVNQSSGFSNICQLFACASSFETYESRDGYSYMTKAFLQEVDKPDTMEQVFRSVKHYHKKQKIIPAGGKASPSVQIVDQMDAFDKISFHDSILNEQELKQKELLLTLPKNCCLEFTKPKLKNKYHQVELRFSAKFSNILIVHVVCDRNLQPEVSGAELECDIQKEDDKTITSFKITNLLDVVQDETFKLQISFQMPQDSSAKETLEYKIPTETIKPTFYHH